MAKSVPKLGPRVGSPVWRSYGHVLSDSARQTLFECLGLKENEPENAKVVLKVIREVQSQLGSYSGGVQAFDNAPRPVDSIRALEQLQKRAWALLDAEIFNSDFYCPKLEETLGAELTERIQLDVARLIDAATVLKKEFNNQRSSGRPPRTALFLVIQGLRSIFRRHYAGPRTPGRRKGAIILPSEAAARELRFVRAALTDAAIPFRGLPNLLRDPRCAVAEDFEPVTAQKIPPV